MKAIILVAGEGSRLGSYTKDRPKCTVDIGGLNLIERQLSVLRSEGVVDITMIGGYKSEMLKKYDTDLILNPRYYETNMVWTLFCAENELRGDILICYGDIVYSHDILRKLLASTADIATTVDMEWEPYWRARNENPLNDAETLKLDSDGYILEIGKKPQSLEEIEGQYMGLIKLTSKGVEQLKKVYYEALHNKYLMGKPIEDAYMTDLLQAVIDKGNPIKSVPIYGEWVEVDTVSDLNAKITLDRLSYIDSCS